MSYIQQFKDSGLPYFSAVNAKSLMETAYLLKGADFYLGGDTGLAHLAESLGTPTKVIFGPTAPDMGFGPWREESQAISSPLPCRPCGKDGRVCYRLTQKHLCLKGLSVEAVFTQIRKEMGR